MHVSQIPDLRQLEAAARIIDPSAWETGDDVCHCAECVESRQRAQYASLGLAHKVMAALNAYGETLMFGSRHPTYLYEHMLRISLEDGRVCRIWRQERSLDEGPYIIDNDELRTIAARQMNLTPGVGAITSICQFEGVNSVEIIDRTGQGMCVHKNWP